MISEILAVIKWLIIQTFLNWQITRIVINDSFTTHSIIVVIACPRHSWFVLELPWTTVRVARMNQTPKKTFMRKLKTKLMMIQRKQEARSHASHLHLRRINKPSQSSKKLLKPSHDAAVARLVRRSHFIWASARAGRSLWSTRPRWTGTATVQAASSTNPHQTCWVSQTRILPITDSCLNSSWM